jgi:hypothetical protein
MLNNSAFNLALPCVISDPRGLLLIEVQLLPNAHTKAKTV